MNSNERLNCLPLNCIILLPYKKNRPLTHTQTIASTITLTHILDQIPLVLSYSRTPPLFSPLPLFYFLERNSTNCSPKNKEPLEKKNDAVSYLYQGLKQPKTSNVKRSLYPRVYLAGTGTAPVWRTSANFPECPTCFRI